MVQEKDKTLKEKQDIVNLLSNMEETLEISKNLNNQKEIDTIIKIKTRKISLCMLQKIGNKLKCNKKEK